MRLVEFDGVWFAPDAVKAVVRALDDTAHLMIFGTVSDPWVDVPDDAEFDRLLALIDPSRREPEREQPNPGFVVQR